MQLEPSRPPWLNLTTRLALLLAILGFAVALAGFAYTGTFTRYWADDYCYNAVLNADGFWKAQVSFYLYTSDRYSVIPLVGISELFGPQAIRFWPLLAIVLSAGGLAWALGPFSRAFRHPIGGLQRLLLGEIITFFCLWQAPNLFQVLYWRTGMLTYWMPLVALVFLVGWVALRSTRPTSPPGVLVLIGLLAFIAGGFSETNAAMQAGALGLALVAAWLLHRLSPFRQAGEMARAWLPFLSSAVLGTLIAMIVLFISPSNGLRLEKMPESAGLVTIVSLSLRFGLDFITDTLSSQPLPTLVSFLVSMALGMLQVAHNPHPTALSWRRWGGLLLAVALFTYLLLVCVMAPSVYIEVAYPEYRALIAARFAMTAGLVSMGWLVGNFAAAQAHSRLPGPWLLAGSALLLVIFSLYSLRATQVTLAEIPTYRQRAAAWDARDQEIRLKRAQGEQDIVVPALDSIAGLMEFQPGKNQWPNNCAAGTYQVQSITGVNP